MKKKIFDQIKNTEFVGFVYPNDTKRFDDSKYFSLDNLFQYRLTKIKFYLENKNGKEFILGLQTFYSSYSGKEVANEEARDKSIKELDIKTFEIPQNDYICNFDIRKGKDGITQLKFKTKKGKDFVVGSDEGEEMKVNFINENKDYIVLYLFGGYRKCLECIAAGYIPLKSYLQSTIGYFELKKKLKDEKFKKATEANIGKFSKSDQILFKVCCLPDTCFNPIIKYCLL